jgi:hypothetical protein
MTAPVQPLPTQEIIYPDSDGQLMADNTKKISTAASRNGATRERTGTTTSRSISRKIALNGD